jgi:hypothetical protein
LLTGTKETSAGALGGSTSSHCAPTVCISSAEAADQHSTQPAEGSLQQRRQAGESAAAAPEAALRRVTSVASYGFTVWSLRRYHQRDTERVYWTGERGNNNERQHLLARFGDWSVAPRFPGTGRLPG